MSGTQVAAETSNVSSRPHVIGDCWCGRIHAPSPFGHSVNTTEHGTTDIKYWQQRTHALSDELVRLIEAAEYVCDGWDIRHVDDAHLENAVEKLRVKLAVTGARGSQRAGAPTRPDNRGGPMESLKRIAEDAFLLAANIREGESLGETEDDIDAREAERQWRIVELVVSLGERVAETAGLDMSDVWIPDAVRDLTDAGVK